MLPNRHDVQAIVLEVLLKNRYLRRKALVMEVCQTLNLSIPTVNRHLRTLVSLGSVQSVPYKNFSKYGILDDDKKAVYLVLSSKTDQAKYFDAVIKALYEGADELRKNALIELELMEDVFLLPNQLNDLLPLLKTEDARASLIIMQIIENHIARGKSPSDLKLFQSMMIECYGRFRGLNPADSDLYKLRPKIIRLLGLLENEKVASFLITDLREKNDYYIKDRYTAWEVAKVLNDHKMQLFQLQVGLDKDAMSQLYQIRKQARAHASQYSTDAKKFHEIFRKHGWRG